MGMYTELTFAAGIDREAYAALNALRSTGQVDDPHPFFKDDRAGCIVDGAGSYYFPQANHFTLVDDDISGPAVSLRANLKNYDGTIEAFLDWIKPHVVQGAGMGGYVGHVLYEEDETPTLIYMGPRLDEEDGT